LAKDLLEIWQIKDQNKTKSPFWKKGKKAI
jgi:hypothetical protein